jgi:nitrite reductase/ring-hydroxylating ferredoxin subunit
MMGRGLLERLEKANKLDRLGDPVQRRVQGMLRGRVRDVLHGVWLGHPLHSVLVQVPVGAWLSAAVVDAVPGMDTCATVLVGLGTAGAVPAVVAGWNDWSELPTAPRRVGLVHAVANGLGVGLYTASLVARLTGNHRLGRRLSYAGLGTVSLGAFLGGHLTYRFAAGVNQAAPELNRIPEGWHDLCELAVLKREQRMVAHIGDVSVLVARSGDTVTAMIERCAHETGPLGDGEFTTINGADCVICPWHGSTFRLADGVVVHGPAATDQPTLRTRIRNGCVQASLA